MYIINQTYSPRTAIFSMKKQRFQELIHQVQTILIDDHSPRKVSACQRISVDCKRSQTASLSSISVLSVPSSIAWETPHLLPYLSLINRSKCCTASSRTCAVVFQPSYMAGILHQFFVKWKDCTLKFWT